MNPMLFIVSLMIFFAGGLSCLVLFRRPRVIQILGPATAVAGCLAALFSALPILAGNRAWVVTHPWSVPMGSFSLGMDALSAVFAAAISVIGILSAMYGAGYLSGGGEKRGLGPSWFFFNMLLAGMLAVVCARNGMLFLFAWEIMSLASFFLVMSDDDRAETRRAGWVYLVATHLGTAFLLAMFVLLSGGGDSLDFSLLGTGGDMRLGSVIFLLALVGFGTKAGFMPFHVWLPEAHPAAPSHVSALMSGVMIKTGIYGLLRTLGFLGAPQTWWGWALLGVGAFSGIAGVLYAMFQNDLKRILAYSSVENMGIIAVGLGLALLGMSGGDTLVAALALSGALFHVWNHAMMKSLLFFGAGSVMHGCGTREVEGLGGLMKRMPVTGGTFLAGSMSISALPPFCGFVGEFLILSAGYHLLMGAGRPASAGLCGILSLGALGLIGGLAAVCFTRAFGMVFLGEPRTDRAAKGHEAGLLMRAPMAVLAFMCLMPGLLSPLFAAPLSRAARIVMSLPCPGGDASAVFMESLLWHVMYGGAALLILILAVVLLRRCLLSGRSVETAVTWDCGYIAPSARMQYTASSYSDPAARMFRFILRRRVRVDAPAGLLPVKANASTSTEDLFESRVFSPVFRALEYCSNHLRLLQQGQNQLYILYIALTILALLIWRLS